LAVIRANPHPSITITWAPARDQFLRNLLNRRPVASEYTFSLQRQCRPERLCECLERNYASDMTASNGDDELNAA
jgi:hypothetical protein